MQTPHNQVISFKSKTVQGNFIEPGRRQSYSGSETDVSTSTENLTAEEKHVLRSGVRQEPQGEETTLNDEMDPSLSNTLIIHHNTPSDNYSSHFYSKKSPSLNLGLSGNMFRFKEYSVTSSGAQQPTNLPPPTSMGFHSAKHPPSNLQDLKLNPNNNVRRRSSGSSPRSSGAGSVPASPKGSPRRTLYPPYSGNSHLKFDGFTQDVGSYSGESQPDHSVQEITEIPKHYLDQSEVLKHLAKEVHRSGSRQPSPPCADSVPKTQPKQGYPYTPPEYPKWYNQPNEYNVDNKVPNDPGGASDDSSNSSTYRYSRAGKVGHLRSNSLQRRLSISRSHPDLTHVGLGVNKSKEQTEGCYVDGRTQSLSNRPKTRGRAAMEVDSETPSSQMLQMIEILSADNQSLKNELDHFHHKVSKLQSFEMEIQKVHQSHEELIRSSDKREHLEKAIRARLEGEIRRLMENNRELKAQLEAVTANLCKQPMMEADDSELRRELSKRDVMIAQLLSQNKELLAEKDRHEIELQAQRATLQEQRNHIDILDNALTNAQANVVRLEEENRKKQVYVDRVGTLQRALANVQLASDRRLTMEKRVRAQLEKEIETLKREKEGKYSGDFREPINGSTEELKKLLRQYEEKIIGLEAEVTKWEQRYVEESTMRQIAVDAAAGTKDAKIAALERTSQESEKLIAQARTEKLRHMDEIYAAQRKSTELEGKIKDMESKLAERDAMIKVLQQHSQEKDAVLQNAVRGRPPRHARAASSVGISTTSSSTACVTSSLGVKSSTGHGNHSASMGGSVGGSGVNNNGGSASISSSNSSSATLHRRVGSKDEMAGSSSMMSPKVKRSSPPSSIPSSLIVDSSEDEKKTLDEQLKELDSRLSSKDSIISALRAEKEKYPSHFWRV